MDSSNIGWQLDLPYVILHLYLSGWFYKRSRANTKTELDRYMDNTACACWIEVKIVPKITVLLDNQNPFNLLFHEQLPGYLKIR